MNGTGMAAAPIRRTFFLMWGMANSFSLRGLGSNFLILTHFLFGKTEDRT